MILIIWTIGLLTGILVVRPEVRFLWSSILGGMSMGLVLIVEGEFKRRKKGKPCD